jgi:hypothetical protein
VFCVSRSREAEWSWRDQCGIKREIGSVERAESRKSFEGFEHWLNGRNGRLMGIRDTIPAAGSRLVGAIGYQSFAFVKEEPSIRPKNLVAHPIRDVNGALSIERDDSRVRRIETRIVMSHDGIAMHRVTEFRGAVNSAWNDRIG